MRMLDAESSNGHVAFAMAFEQLFLLLAHFGPAVGRKNSIRGASCGMGWNTPAAAMMEGGSVRSPLAGHAAVR
jgi:hypothetical protein